MGGLEGLGGDGVQARRPAARARIARANKAKQNKWDFHPLHQATEDKSEESENEAEKS